MLRQVYRAVRSFGLDPVRFFTSVISLPGYLRDWREFSRASHLGEGPRVSALYPILNDVKASAGEARGHYFHQDLWAARKVFVAKPREHVDVGSRIDGFVAHLLTFMDVQVVDIRPLATSVRGLTFVQADATTLSGFPDDSVVSISSLHAIEHFGLGRYGDPVDPGAWVVALRSLARVLARGGRLYVSVPIGVERVEFNAHRVFSPGRIPAVLSGLKLLSFSAVDDGGDLRTDARLEAFERADYSCGLYEFTKA